MGHSYTTPVTATTHGSVNASGYMAWVNSNTTITGGQTIAWKCTYTLFGTWNSESNGWIIRDFRKPNLGCE